MEEEYSTDEDGMPIGEFAEGDSEEVVMFKRFATLPRAPWDWLLSLFPGDDMRFDYYDRYSEIYSEFEELQHFHSNAFSGFQLIAQRMVTDELTINHIISYLFPENNQPYSISMSHSYGPFEGFFFPIITNLFMSTRIVPHQLAILTDWYLNFTHFAPKIMGLQTTEIGAVIQTVSGPNPNAPFFGGGELDIEMPTSQLGLQYSVRDASWGVNFCQSISEKWMVGTAFEYAQGIAILSQGVRTFSETCAYAAVCQWHTMTGFFSASMGVMQTTYVGAVLLASLNVSPQQAQGGGISWEPSANFGLEWPTDNGEAKVVINS